MSVISMAVIGKNNEPLYLREFYDSDSIGEEGCCTDEELFGLPPSATVHLSPPTTVKVHSGIDNKISTECSLRQQFILHAALDRFEQIAGPHPGFGWRTSSVFGQEAMWVGLLCPVEDMRVYGYMTTTHIKFLLILSDDASTALNEQRAIDEAIKHLFFKLHRLFVEYTLNPFSPLTGEPLQSPRFDQKVQDCILSFNRTI